MPMDTASAVGWPIVRMEGDRLDRGPYGPPPPGGLPVLRLRWADRPRNSLGHGVCSAECCVERGSGDLTLHLSDLSRDAWRDLADDLVACSAAMMSSRSVIAVAYNALKVVAETKEIREWVGENDPKALTQVRQAIRQLEERVQVLTDVPF